MKLRAGQFEFSFPRPALVMGIVNVTPDSFSDGGHFFEPQAAADHALRLAEEGADLIDIGGESSRPRAVPVGEQEELRRVMPVLERLKGRLKVPISIDTVKPGVAREALRAGASIINDIGANRTDPAMWRLAAESGSGYICVHMQGTPQTMQLNPCYTDVVGEVESFFFQHLEQLRNCGVGQEQIILDPGIGFGKTLENNLELLAAVKRFGRLERPLLLGVSRKSFLSKLPGARPGAPLAGALACACLAVEAGASIIRAHEVAETAQALGAAQAVLRKRKE